MQGPKLKAGSIWLSQEGLAAVYQSGFSSIRRKTSETAGRWGDQNACVHRSLQMSAGTEQCVYKLGEKHFPSQPQPGSRDSESKFIFC